MDGANLGVDVVPLASVGDTFAILCRFPPGFERAVPGGYLVAEEFLVLSGELELEGVLYSPGCLTVIPACYLRQHMSAQGEVTVLAWFGGPAVFRAPAELGDSAIAGDIISVQVTADSSRELLRTSEARWTLREFTGEAEPVVGSDLIDLGLQAWRHVSDENPFRELRGSHVERVPAVLA